MDRRRTLEATATAGLGALAGGALPGTASTAVRTPFSVPDAFIPIVGSDIDSLPNLGVKIVKRLWECC